MKLITFLMFICLLQVNAASNAQVTIHNKNITLENVFKEIQKQSGYDFFYDSNLFKNLPPVSLNVDHATVQEVLTACLPNGSFQYKVVNNSVVITAKPALVLPLKPPPIKIDGVVKDERGKPIEGVTIMVKGKSNLTTSTNKEGNFTISGLEQGDVLIFKYLGYANKEINIGNKNTLNISLEPVESALGAVQISTGYQLIKPEQSTGSITIMSHKEFDSRINTTNFLAGLQSKIPGVLINDDIEFEGNSLFQIRGISTIFGNKQPLIVIDGYPTELSLATINPNEIESITVLRDAAAATVYGVRASNGVIVIERKKAKIGKTNVTYRSTFSFTPKEDYTRYRWDKDGSNTIIDFVKESNPNIGASSWPLITSPTIGSLFTYNLPYNILAQKAAGVITADEANRQLEALKLHNNTEDYQRLFLQTATTQTHNLDLSGGNESATYYITALYNNSVSTKIQNGNSRFGLSARTNLKLSKRFSVDLNINFQESRDYLSPVPNITTLYPYERLIDDNGNPLSTFTGSKVSPFYNTVITNLGLLDNMYYPLQEVNLVSDKTHVANNRFTANFRYDIAKGLNLSFGGVYETARNEKRHLASENSAEVRQYVNRYTELTAGNFTYNLPKGDYLRIINTKTESYTGRAQLNYNKLIAQNHSINLIAGVEVRRLLNTSSSSAFFGYSDQTLLQRPVNYSLIQSTAFLPVYGRTNSALSYESLFAQTYNEDRFLSGYTNAVYSYKGKYSFTASARIDQSNLFGQDPKNRYKPSWSFGANWNVDREKFIESQPWINSIKMRAALGFNGNVAKNALPQVIASARLNIFDNTINTLQLLSPANSRLRWEQTFNFNSGVDYRIFKNITGNVDYYIKRSIDILASNEVDPTRGVTSAIINQSSIRNSGLEIGLHADWINQKRLNWNTGFILSKNMSKILKVYNVNVPPNSKSFTYALGNRTNYLEGYAVGSIFNYRYAGIDEKGAVLIYDKDGKTKNFDVNDQGLADIDYVGSSIPTHNIGLSNRVDIGDFYIYAMVSYFGGFKTRIPLPDPTVMRPLEGANNFWRKAGDENIPGIMPALKYANYNTYLSATDRFIVNGAYVTINDITASYSFRKSNFVKKAKLSNLELRAQASNLYTFAMNKQNYSVATRSYEKTYLTPTYTMALQVNF